MKKILIAALIVVATVSQARQLFSLPHTDTATQKLTKSSVPVHSATVLKRLA